MITTEDCTIRRGCINALQAVQNPISMDQPTGMGNCDRSLCPTPLARSSTSGAEFRLTQCLPQRLSGWARRIRCNTISRGVPVRTTIGSPWPSGIGVCNARPKGMGSFFPWFDRWFSRLHGWGKPSFLTNAAATLRSFPRCSTHIARCSGVRNPDCGRNLSQL